MQVWMSIVLPGLVGTGAFLLISWISVRALRRVEEQVEERLEYYFQNWRDLLEDKDLRAILSFLDWDAPDSDAFGNDTKIVLASAGFSRELATSVLWLNERDSTLLAFASNPTGWAKISSLTSRQSFPCRVPKTTPSVSARRSVKQGAHAASIATGRATTLPLAAACTQAFRKPERSSRRSSTSAIRACRRSWSSRPSRLGWATGSESMV